MYKYFLAVLRVFIISEKGSKSKNIIERLFEVLLQ